MRLLRTLLRPPEVPLLTSWGLLLLRLGICPPLMYYGYDKLTNYLNGERGFADPIGLGEEITLLLAIFAEFVCPVWIMLGLFMRVALLPSILTMAVAFFIVHSHDSWEQREHSLLFMIPFLTLLLAGPGRFSLDQKLFGK